MMTRSILLNLVAAASAIAALSGCTAARSPAATSVRPEVLVPRQGTNPFSGVIRVGNLLFVAGQLGTDERGIVPGGIGSETAAAMTNISKLLAQAGSSMDRVAKCTVFLSDMGQWAAMNDAYMKFFPTNPPVRSSFGVTGLALGGHVEIECIAAAG
jgi:reactive intermediate/imine deaminase